MAGCVYPRPDFAPLAPSEASPLVTNSANGAWTVALSDTAIALDYPSRGIAERFSLPPQRPILSGYEYVHKDITERVHFGADRCGASSKAPDQLFLREIEYAGETWMGCGARISSAPSMQSL